MGPAIATVYTRTFPQDRTPWALCTHGSTCPHTSCQGPLAPRPCFASLLRDRCARTLPTALAAPVLEGMMLPFTARPPRQSFLLGPSTGFCVAVVACTVVIRPPTMPNLSWMTCVLRACAAAEPARGELSTLCVAYTLACARARACAPQLWRHELLCAH